MYGKIISIVSRNLVLLVTTECDCVEDVVSSGQWPHLQWQDVGSFTLTLPLRAVNEHSRSLTVPS